MGKSMPIFSEKSVSKFWSKVSFTANNNLCWRWIGAKERYGRFGVNKQGTFLAHRVSYYLYTGIDPIGKLVMHSCDNPECVNPNHLSAGTSKDNYEDMVSKNRQNQENIGIQNGEKNIFAKLDNESILEIRKLFSFGLKQKVLAKLYNVTHQCISAIVTRKNWNFL